MSSDSSLSAFGQSSVAGKTVALGVTGSIAAFKAFDIARQLIKQGVRVLPVLTRSAARFVGPIGFTGICGEPARVDMWDESFAGELHVYLATQADLVLIAPATADVLARFASGRADDLLTALVLAAKGPVLAAPAMYPRMWAHPATQRNVQSILQDGRVQLVGPVVGQVANGEVGLGRMAEPTDIVQAALSALRVKDLQGRHVVVTAGPTVEDIDPVRFVSNRSSGRMGFALAAQAASRGAKVTLITGPVELSTPFGVERVNVRSALSMREALWQAMGSELEKADALIMAAAVGDYRPRVTHPTKQKRSAESITLALEPNPDLLAELGAARTAAPPVLIGFAVESAPDEQILEYARGKLKQKRVDLVVANAAQEAFGKETNRAMLVSHDRVQRLEVMSKTALSDQILDWLRARLMGEVS